MEFRCALSGTEYFLKMGDLTLEKADAIVNAASSGLMGGGGVDGAIHRRGGPKILEECKQIVEKRGRLEPGQAVLTSGGDLPARFVLHTVGPYWNGGQRGEPEILRQCYVSCLTLAREHQLKTVVFPSIATGAFRFPLPLAARIAQSIVREEVEWGGFQSVGFVLFDGTTYTAYYDEWGKLGKAPSQSE